jgi:hypothetical protein
MFLHKGRAAARADEQREALKGLKVQRTRQRAGARAKQALPPTSIALNVGISLERLVTPFSELVVAPAGYILHALTTPAAFAAAISSGLVASVRYSVIIGSKFAPSGSAARIRSATQ